MDKTFEREYSFEDGDDTLVLSQLEKGDVNCVVWDAALVLAKYLEVKSMQNPEWLRNKRVLELGSGLGCVGLVAAYYGANVTATDQPKALPLLQHNIKENKKLMASKKATIVSRALDWNEAPQLEFFQIILLADCIYYEQSILPLISTIILLSTKETEIILSQEDRSYSEKQLKTWNTFVKEVQNYFTIVEIPLNEQHHVYRSSDIHLLRLYKKDE